MERLLERLAIAQKALKSLKELLKPNVSTIERDAAIQRFEYSFEAVWKSAQLYLRHAEGIEEGSPKGVIRASFKVKLLDDTQARKALDMVQQRNLTVHTYNEDLAQQIFKQLPEFSQIMSVWLESMSSKLKS